MAAIPGPENIHWTYSITRLIIEQVLQNAEHFTLFKWLLSRMGTKKQRANKE
jgi:hypothetical protein